MKKPLKSKRWRFGCLKHNFQANISSNFWFKNLTKNMR